jgi:RHS repeat-associated protein
VAPDRSTGRVTKVANLGRAGETVDDLDHPTATFSYTFATFADDTWTPASAHTTTRRVHWMGSETTDFDEAWVYFDGSGRELLSKARAAPHPSTPSTPRFVGSGRVLLDAKGNPVKQYEPYFSATSDFEPDGGFDGVTPVLSYDPLGRLVRTDFPDGTHATVVRTPWSETHYDRADTLPDIDGYTPDPEEEPDEETLLQAILREFEAGVPGTLATGHPWLDARGNTSVAGVDDFLTIARGKALRRSAGQSWASRNTPTVVHVDPLGRPFLEQRAKTSTAGDTTDVHVTLDLQGRATAISARYVPEGETVRVTQLATTDVFDLLGRSLRHVRRDAQASGGTGGQTWVLPSVDGQPIRTWDSRDQAFRRTFDALRRPRATFVEEGSSGEFCRLFTRYGERATTPKAARLLGQPWRVYDTAGLVTTLAVDVDNRVTSTARRFLEAFRGLPDWSDQEFDPETASEPTWLLDAAGADPEVYTQTATLDIAGRPLHDAVYRDVAAKHERRYGYDAGGQLVSVEVQSPGTSGWRPVVHDVTYNARGQRTKVLAGDDTGDASLETTYSYDADTFRLVRLAVTRLTDDEVLQDIRWVHDAVGNVTFQEDLGTDAVWFDNTTVQPHREYAYDALDRLIEATGREHQSTFSATGGDTRQTHRPYGLGPKAHAADGNALRSYTQRYEYDDVGNLRVLRHVVGVDTTERTYAYTEEVDGSLFNNRLLSTTVGSTTYPLTYDAHGNVTSMSHLPEMAWDAFDRLASVQTTARYPDVGADDEDEDELETPVDHDWFYVYDGAGQRVRKVRAASSSGVLRWEERLYVGPFEVWRKYDGSGDTSVERETLHVQDGDRRVAMVETLSWDGGTEETSPVARWRYQLDDHLGTACGEVTETGLVIGWEEYHPYGTTAVWSFDATREVSGKRYRYTGMERDDETGLGYHSARYYAGWLGRWVACDPIGVQGGINAYQYAGGSPAGRCDPSGLAPPVAPELEGGPAPIFGSSASAPTTQKLPIRTLGRNENVTLNISEVREDPFKIGSEAERYMSGKFGIDDVFEKYVTDAFHLPNRPTVDVTATLLHDDMYSLSYNISWDPNRIPAADSLVDLEAPLERQRFVQRGYTIREHEAGVHRENWRSIMTEDFVKSILSPQGIEIKLPSVNDDFRTQPMDYSGHKATIAGISLPTMVSIPGAISDSDASGRATSVLGPQISDFLHGRVAEVDYAYSHLRQYTNIRQNVYETIYDDATGDAVDVKLRPQRPPPKLPNTIR